MLYKIINSQEIFIFSFFPQWRVGMHSGFREASGLLDAHLRSKYGCFSSLDLRDVSKKFGDSQM